MLDEDYAEQVSERTKAAVAFLRAEGKTVGSAPFGTQRDEEGFFEPSPKGAWLLPDGRFVKGKADQPPRRARSGVVFSTARGTSWKSTPKTRSAWIRLLTG
jgi:hypothetical protein